MSVADVFIPLIVGLLLVARPQIFFKGGGSVEEVAKKSGRIRKIGYVLLAVGALYCVIALVGTR
jgi:sorbitol-specific phosphotransferase system component IIC